MVPNHFPPLHDSEKQTLWCTISYERLVAGGIQSIRKMFASLDLQMPDVVKEKWNLLSKSTVAGSPILYGGNQLDGWKKHLSADQIKRIMGVVNYFDLNSVYSADSNWANITDDILLR